MTFRQRPTRPAPLAAAVILSVLSALSAADARERVVAVGDIHGNFDGLVSILKRAELIDEGLHWVGGSTNLVQTGDIFDRGVEVREVLDLLMRLEEEAAEDGGKVTVLLGNHEGMNLIGFYRDVNPEVFATFADENSEKRRKREFKDFRKYWRAQAEALGIENPVISAEIKNTWLEAFPPGWFEYNEAIGPEGRYGIWLRKRPVAVMVGDVLFVHGGIGPDLAGLSVVDINQKVARELATYDRLRAEMVAERLVPATAGLGSLMEAYGRQDPPDPKYAALAGANAWLIRSPGGPLWFRGGARWDEEVDAARMAELLDGIGAKRVVGGHTVQDEGRIEVRFGGRVILIDTGMLSTVYQGGRPSALVIEDGVFSAIYTDGTSEVLIDDALPAAA